MMKWKLFRQSFGNEEFTLTEGEEVTVGRAMSNTITLSSIVISRFHCVLKVQKNNVLIIDLKSSNGVYVGLEKIPQNQPYTLKDTDIVGFGWIAGAPLANINDEEKYVFKLCKEDCQRDTSLIQRIQYQNENEVDDIEEQLAVLEADKIKSPKIQSPRNKLSLKRKAEIIDSDQIKVEMKQEKISRIVDVVNLLSDSEDENHKKQTDPKDCKIKLEESLADSNNVLMRDKFKFENEFTEYEAFDVKQEYFGFDDEPITVDSESDGESNHWYLRLSQSSPGKPFNKLSEDKSIVKQDESSYSQMDDEYASFVDNQEEFLDDMITIPPETPKQANQNKMHTDEEEDIIFLDHSAITTSRPITEKDIGRDEVDTFQPDHIHSS